MANAAKMAANPATRLLLTGYPGSGKTGALASLANAGFKLRIIDFDGNPESLLQFTDKDKLANIDIVSLEDSIAQQGAFLGPKGLPQAFIRSLKLMDSWKYTEPDGTEVDLGKSSEWGPDTIVVVDGMTGLSQACFSHAQAVSNKTPLNTTQAVWGLAIHNQLQFIKRLTASANRHHVILISHLKMVGPKLMEANENSVNAELKERAADLIPTRLYPTALGQQLPQTVAGEFPVVAHISLANKGKTMLRSFQVQPSPEMDIKMPVKNIEALQGLGLEDGLIRIFQALGCNPPPKTPVTAA